MVSPNNPSKHPVSRSINAADVLALAQASIDHARPSGVPDGTALTSVSQEIDAFAIQLHAAVRKQLHDAATSTVSSRDTAYAHCLDDTTLGRFRIIRPIGYGAFGIVLLAFDPRLQREVALKVPRPETLAHKETRRRVLREARGAAVLDHQGIVPVHDVGRAGPIWYIASAFCNGPNLHDWLQLNQPLQPRQAADLVAQIADAVQHAHSRGILHRDLKPSNVLLKFSKADDHASTPITLLTDFGLSTRFPRSPGAPPEAGLAGTLSYMSPEQTAGDPTAITIATDVYSLGAILFELITGRPPFIGENESALIAQIREELPPPLRTIRPGTPIALDAICRKCLRKDTAARYGSAAELADDLRRYLTGQCVKAQPAGPGRRAISWCRRHPAVAGLSFAVISTILVGALFTLYYWHRSEQNLAHARTAVIDLGWAIDDVMFWQSETTARDPAQLHEIVERYAVLLRTLGDHPSAEPVRATLDCYHARMYEFDRKADLALKSYDRSIDRWLAIVHANPDALTYRRALARTMYCETLCRSWSEGVTLDKGPLPRFDFSGGNAARETIDTRIKEDYVELLFDKAEGLRKQHIPRASNQHFAACLRTCQHLAHLGADSHRLCFLALLCQDRLAGIHSSENSRLDSYRSRAKVLDGLRELVSQHPGMQEYQLAFARLAVWVATHGSKQYVAESPDRIESLFNAAVGTLRALADNGCTDPELTAAYADTLEKFSLYALDTSDHAKAVSLAGECLVWSEAAAKRGTISQLQLAQSYRNMAKLYGACGEQTLERNALARSGGLYQIACHGAARNRAVHLQHADVWKSLANMQEEHGDTKAAITSYQNAINALEAWRGAHPDEPHMASELSNLRSTLTRLTNIEVI